MGVVVEEYLSLPDAAGAEHGAGEAVAYEGAVVAVEVVLCLSREVRCFRLVPPRKKCLSKGGVHDGARSCHPAGGREDRHG